MDRLPPHDQNSEMCIIGCCLLTPKESIPEIQATITSIEYFYSVACQEAWALIRNEEIDKVDIISLSGRIAIQFLADCQELVPSTANLPSWLEIVQEKYIARRLIQVCTNIISSCYKATNPVEVLNLAEREILAIRPNQKSPSDIKTLVHEAINKIEQKCFSDGSITGLSTGLSDLDRLTDGLHKSEMVVVAALPSRGKTVLAVNVAIHNALKGIPVAIFSAEMRPVQLVIRSLCSESRINFHRISTNDVPNLTVSASKLANAPLYIEQASGFTAEQVCGIARRLHQKYQIRLIVIDYQQRLIGQGDNQEQKTAFISKCVKDLAMELDVPILLLSQVNEDGKTKHARATTEDTDSLWKLENDGEWQADVQPLNLRVEKSRDGSTGLVPLTFLKTITRIESASKVSDSDVP